MINSSAFHEEERHGKCARLISLAKSCVCVDLQRHLVLRRYVIEESAGCIQYFDITESVQLGQIGTCSWILLILIWHAYFKIHLNDVDSKLGPYHTPAEGFTWSHCTSLGSHMQTRAFSGRTWDSDQLSDPPNFLLDFLDHLGSVALRFASIGLKTQIRISVHGIGGIAVPHTDTQRAWRRNRHLPVGPGVGLHGVIAPFEVLDSTSDSLGQNPKPCSRLNRHVNGQIHAEMINNTIYNDDLMMISVIGENA